MPYNLDFCERFGYPVQVRNHFVQILDQIHLHLGVENVILVVLFGSTSRGELTYEITEDNQIELFSDYEFLIVTKKGIPRERVTRLVQAFLENKVRWQITNPLFHTEFMYNTAIKLNTKRLMVRNIPSFELFETGIVIYGEEQVWRKYVGRITPQNLNLGATNELIIERLWKQLQLVWESGSDGTGKMRSDRVAMYFTARNALEILTILLPNVGVLIPGYQARNEYFAQHSEYSDFLPPTLGPFLRDCLDAKLNLRFSGAYEYYYEQMLSGYLALTSWLINSENGRATTLSQLPDVCRLLTGIKHLIFREPLIWQCVRVMKDYRMARKLGILRPPRWALREKRPHVLALLMYIHWWILGQLCCYKLPEDSLHEAQQLLAKINLSGETSSSDWAGVVNQTYGLLESWRKTS